jgi:hypothetical protein
MQNNYYYHQDNHIQGRYFYKKVQCTVCGVEFDWTEKNEAPKTCSKEECLRKYHLKGVKI